MNFSNMLSRLKYSLFDLLELFLEALLIIILFFYTLYYSNENSEYLVFNPFATSVAYRRHSRDE